MRFSLNRRLLLANMFNNERLEHRTGKMIRLFPFPANATGLNDDVKYDLKDFKGIAGACFRECLQISHKNTFLKEEFIQNVCATANAAGNADLKEMIEKIAFNDQGQLVLFDVQIYPHIRNGNGKENKTLNDIGKFAVSLFFDEADKENLGRLARRDPDNLFYKLVLDCMPKPEAGESEAEPYYQASPELKRLFKKDLETLTADMELFIGNFHQLIKFYFFKYVSDLALRLSSFFEEPKLRLFFSVKWEKLQGARAPLNYGWEAFEGLLMPMFPHAVLTELLNYIDGFGVTQLVYSDIKAEAALLGADEMAELTGCITELTDLYCQGLADVNWASFPAIETTECNPVFAAVKRLFALIEFQFDQTNRGRARAAYQEWMLEFSRSNFSKRRGQWGNSLALDERFVLLLTRLCVGAQEKIRLKDLWSGLEERGVYLDTISRDHIVGYFEKINLLEKKSDSGDAQYVRRFSQTLL